MKNFLQKKWIGFVVVVTFSLFMAFRLTKFAELFLIEYSPKIEQEVSDFLPITIENGQITQPVDTVIEKNYNIDNLSFKIVLDTRIDEFQASSLKEPGLYVSKKCFHTVTKEKTQIDCFDEKFKDNLVINKDHLKNMFSYIQNNMGKYLFVGGFIFLFLFYYLAILLYTLLSHWIIVIWFKRKFLETFYINTLTYVLIELLTTLLSFNLNAITRFIMFVIVNMGICYLLFNSKDEKKSEDDEKK